MIDSKRHIFDCSGRAKAEKPARTKEKREQGSRTPKIAFSKLNSTKGTTKVKGNLGGGSVSNYASYQASEARPPFPESLMSLPMPVKLRGLW